MANSLVVIGLGYVGLPVAIAFAEAGLEVIGFDTDPRRVAEINGGHDRTGEIAGAALRASGLHATTDARALAGYDAFIVTVPTPLTTAGEPDLGPLLAATKTVAGAVRTGALVVYESTVHPGATEEECLPLLEHLSGLREGIQFDLAYSPERINPGDPTHRLRDIAKVVSATSANGLDRVERLYARIIRAPVHRAASIRVAEAAKIIENAQRDLNIAFVNELARICDRLGLDTRDVLATAATKWNFLPFEPGLVGGHCIGVDPIYLARRAERAGYRPEVIVTGRRINDAMAEFIAQRCIGMLAPGDAASRRVTLLGVTFKENVPDMRNSPAVELARHLMAAGVTLQLADPLADPDQVFSALGLPLTPAELLTPGDATIFAVAHAGFVEAGWSLIRRTLRAEGGIVLDVKARLTRGDAPAGVTLWRL